MGKKIKNIVEIILILTWIPVAVMYFSPSEPSLISDSIDISSLTSGTRWWLVLYRNKKIGYSYLKLIPEDGDYSVEDFLFMKLTTFGKQQLLYSRLKGKLSKDLRIMTFSFSITTPTGINFSGEGKYEHGKLLIDLKTPSGKETISLPSPEAPFLPDLAYDLVNRKKVRVGEKFTFPFYDPLLGKEVNGTIEVVEEIPYRYMGKIIRAYRVKFVYGNTLVTAIISPEIGVLEEDSGGGFVLKRVTKEEALAPLENVNIIWSVAIPSNKPISEPEKLTEISYKISGINLQEFDLDGGVQDLEDNILIIHRASIPRKIQHLPLKKLQNYLARTPFIQTGAQEFQTVVKKVAGGDVVETARNLNHWVFKYLKQEPVVSVPSALQVLKMKKGDCNEHAVLLTALLRTAGIPAREVAGVVYQNGYFFYHAWVEVFLGKWIPVDPTFDQFPADVTHIRFIIGGIENQVKVLDMINRVKIEVLDYRR